MSTWADGLTRAFDEWERAGRGVEVYPGRVRPEPGFRIFRPPVPTEPIDDARRSTWLSRLFEPEPPKPEPPQPAEPQGGGIPFDGPADIREYQIALPAEWRGDPASPAGFLSGLSTLSEPCSFELIGGRGTLRAQMTFGVRDETIVLGQLRAFFPGIYTSQASPLRDLWCDTGEYGVVLELGLGELFVIPLELPELGVDPLASLCSALRDFGSDELGVVQVLFEEVRAPWSRQILDVMTTPSGKPLFADAPELTGLAQEKTRTTLHAACVRLGVTGPSAEAIEENLRRLAAGLCVFGRPDRNELVPLEHWEGIDTASDLLDRATHRTGMLLSARELSALVHPPAPSLLAEEKAEVAKTKRAPKEAQRAEGVLLGESTHGDNTVDVRLDVASRLRHLYVIGASGTGKSTLITNLILEDARAGRGVAVLDPHGDLIDETLARLPEERLDDVVLFDPADPEYQTGWNVLGAHSETEREMLASDLVAVFRRLSTSWGDQMTTVLANAVQAMLSSPQGGTLLELKRFLLDPEFRRSYIETVEDEYARDFWSWDFPLLADGGKKTPQAPILTRLDTFLRNRKVREALTEREKPLDFRKLVDEQKILLARLSQGAIGEANAAFVGSMLVSKLHQTFLSRQDVAQAERTPFFLYLDEFHELATPSMSTIFSGVRKYGLGVLVAHQELYQLHAKLPEVEHAVHANAHTRIVFRISDDDSRRLERGFGFFDRDDLCNLGMGEAICRVGRKDDDFNLKTFPLPEVDGAQAKARIAEARERSGKSYGRKRTESSRAKAKQTAKVPSAGEARASIEAPRIPDAPPVETRESPPPSGRTAPPRTTPPRELPRVKVEDEPTAGRGGKEHKYLQELIRKWGQSRGFKAEVEKDLPDGGGRTDVLLSQNERKIAVEVAMTTSVKDEFGSIRKRLQGGASEVAVVSTRKKFLEKLDLDLRANLPSDLLDRVRLFSPEEFLTYLDEERAEEGTRVAGYKVKTIYTESTKEEVDVHRQAIADVVRRGLKRVKKSDEGTR